jgi:hypothetical protein
VRLGMNWLGNAKVRKLFYFVIRADHESPESK